MQVFNFVSIIIQDITKVFKVLNKYAVFHGAVQLDVDFSQNYSRVGRLRRRVASVHPARRVGDPMRFSDKKQKRSITSLRNFCILFENSVNLNTIKSRAPRVFSLF